jgi:hypothetical protein
VATKTNNRHQQSRKSNGHRHASQFAITAEQSNQKARSGYTYGEQSECQQVV